MMSPTLMPAIAATSLIYPNVHLAEDAEIGPFVVVGEAARGQQPGDVATTIGAGAVLRSHTVIYAGNVIGDGFQTGHGALLREDNTIGHNVSIGSHSIIEHHVRIDDGARVHSNAFIPEYSVLEEKAWVGPCVTVTNARYPQSPSAKHNLEGVHIGRNARIGAGAVLLPGVRIGAGALVGAGAVVTKDVPPGAVVAGNPARVIKQVREIAAYEESPSP